MNDHDNDYHHDHHHHHHHHHHGHFAEAEMMEIGELHDGHTEAASEMSDIPIEKGDHGASLPSTEEIRADGQTSHRGVEPHPKGKAIVLFLAILTILTVIIGLSVALTVNRSGRESSPASNNQDVSDAPAVRVSSLPDVVNWLTEFGVSSRESLMMETSAQAMAARWMAEEDGMNLKVPDGSPVTSRDAYQYMARYIMAVNYFSLDGPSWEMQFNFLTALNICQWNGFVFDAAGNPDLMGVICSINDYDPAGILLDWVKMEGIIPTENGLLTSLKMFDLNFNPRISGQMPTELCQLTELRILALGFNAMTGTIPTCIEKLSNLEILFLSSTGMFGLLPSGISYLTKLDLLYLDHNQFVGNIETMFDKMPNLTALVLGNNQLTGVVDESFLKNNLELIEIDLSNNGLYSVQGLPDHFFNDTAMPKLKLLDLHENRLSGKLPENIPINTVLQFVALHENELTGAIPPSIKNLTKLYHLDLSANSLAGDIPSELGDMTKLEYLFLGGNSGFFPGPIPTSFGNLVNLTELDLKTCQRNGTLPEFLVNLKKLVLLDLDNNDFTGPIPSVYGELTKLQFLMLNRNHLTGQIPSSFESLTGLRTAFFEQNQITGNFSVLCALDTFNELVGDKDGTELLAADCAGSSTEASPLVSCSCCNVCCPGSIEGNNVDASWTCNPDTFIPSQDPSWDDFYVRVNYDLGNKTRFVNRFFLGEGLFNRRRQLRQKVLTESMA